MIPAAGEHGLPDRNLFVAHHIIHHDFPVGRSPQDSLQPCLLQNRADSAALIIDQQNLRNRRIGQQHLAHNSVRGDHSHVTRDARVLTLVDINNARQIASARPNDLRSDCLGDNLFFKGQQRLQAARLGSIFAKPDLIQTHLLDLLLEFAVLGSYST